jgi:iron(II)-dependent oxidoreductase
LFAFRVAGVTMQIEGLARAAMPGLYEGDRLAIGLRDARERTRALYGHLDLERIEFPCIAIVNPALWELSHIAWFQEYWCLRHEKGRASMLPGADGLFDSRTVPHDTRWHLPYPPAGELFRYMDATLEATLEALASTPPERRYFFALALLHEDMHGEALLMTLQTLGLSAPALGAALPSVSPWPVSRDVAFAGGEFLQGSARESPHFVFDNEKWAHACRIGPFAMASHPVTQGEFAAFVEEGGYARPALWTEDGWEWKTQASLAAPRGWRREGSRWHRRAFDRWIAIDAGAPMVNVSLHEALAYCRWAGRRLASETEWEFAARNGGTDDRYPWGDAPETTAALDLHHLAPSPLAHDEPRARSGLRQLIGGVWEWTSSPFAPYPGFHPDPYREYSEPWFHSHFVLRGGSFATRSRLVHNRFRNFYLPGRNDVFAGFRTCALE